MKPVLHQILPVVTFIVLMSVTSYILLRMSVKMVDEKEPSRYVEPSKPLLVKDGVDKVACLPESTTFTPRECTQQSDCSNCNEATSCVAAEGTLTFPIQDDGGECSGHGHKEGNVCVCDGEKDGDVCVSDVCYSGDKCEIANVKLDPPGQYCLPDYLNKCNPYTSDTLLSTDERGTSWRCRCKSTMAGVFTQSVEGGSCDVEIACGRTPVSAQVNVGTLHEPRFETRTMYPNRLVSYEDQEQGSVPCAYKTTTNSDGDVVPHPEADSTCIPRTHTNKCTITDEHGHYQVIRGSGAPGDLEMKRVSPAFYPPVPPGLNRCPDGWIGDGAKSLCRKQGETPFSLFTGDGEWKGPDITSMSDLKTWWAQQNKGTWTGVNRLPLPDVSCLESFTSESPASNLCVTPDCKAAYGRRERDWDGDVDGPLVDHDGRPHWETGGEYGGHCACAPGETSTGWDCVVDDCANNNHPDGYKDGDACVCPSKSTERPFSTSLSYKHPNAPPTCVNDPCNPNGVAVSASQLSCTTESDCGGVCVENQCHIPTGSTCHSDLDCSNMTGMSQNVAKCVDNACVVLDMQRAQMGSTCSQDSNCSLGACVGEEGAKTCTGGCACGSGFKQVSDGGMSPLGATCVDDCIGKCKNGGMCIRLPDGSTECRCTAFYGGENCETPLCARDYEYCDAQTPCCNQCLCNSTSSSCCNRFPDLKAPDQTAVLACVNNTCQPNHLSDEDFANLQCLDNQNQCKAASHYTPDPPPCGGWGIKDENGRCQCHASRVGDECQEPTCSDEHQQCTYDADCCNHCECKAGDSDCCPPTYDSSRHNMSCVGGFCKPNTTPKTQTCKPDDGVMCKDRCHQGNVSWSMYIDPTKIVGTSPKVNGGPEQVDLLGLNKFWVPEFTVVQSDLDGVKMLSWTRKSGNKRGIVAFTMEEGEPVRISLNIIFESGVYAGISFSDEFVSDDLLEIRDAHACIADGRSIKSPTTSSFLIRYSHVDRGVDPCVWGMYNSCTCPNPFADTKVKWGVLDAYGNKIFLYRHPGKAKYYDNDIAFIGGERVYHPSTDTYVLVSNYKDTFGNINIQLEVDDPTRTLNPRTRMIIRLRLEMGRARSTRTITAQRTVNYTGCGLIDAMRSTSDNWGLAVNENYCDSRRGGGQECNGGGVLYLKWFD